MPFPSVRDYPFLTLAQALVILRIAVATFFFAHASVRIWLDSIPQFGAFLDARGYSPGELIVWLITLFEIGGSLLLAFGRLVRWLTLGFAFITTMGIVIIHFQLGWFVGEHGTGGMEYSVSLLVSLLVLAAADRAQPERPS